MRGPLIVGLTFFLAGLMTARQALMAAENDRPVMTRQTAFAIPFTFDPLAGGAHEIQLYVSGDRGRDWALYQRQLSSAGRFVFRTGQDGEYWFAVRTVGSAVEPISASTKPDLRVVVDTTQPKLELDAKTGPSGEMDTRWFLGDLNIDPSSLRLEYQAAEGGPWKPVNIDLGDPSPDAKTHSGKTVWRPNAGEQVTAIRADVRDRAGNVTTITRKLETLAMSNLAEQAAGDEHPPSYPDSGTSNDPQPMAASVPWPGQRAQNAPAAHGPSTRQWHPPTAFGDSEQQLASARASQTAQRSMVSATRGSAGGRHLGRTDMWPTDRVDPLARRYHEEGTNPDSAGSVARFLPASVRSDVFPRDERPLVSPTAARSSVEADVSSRGEKPRACRSDRFQLDYEVEEADKVGLAGVELWYTTDGGRQWALYGEDHDRTSPFQVQLENEGTYGFRLVLRSADGLSGRPPQSGDPADMWIHADWTAPTARLTSAQYGSGEQLGKLVICWEASDGHLADRPVSLFYARNSHGPWTTIAAGLSDVGQYAWQVDQRVPRDFYLRLEVIDQAGNISEDQLFEPISSDGLAPQGRIRSVRPLTEPDSREAVAHPGPSRAR